MDQIRTTFWEAELSETPVIQSLFELFGLSKGGHFWIHFGTPPNLVLGGNLIKLWKGLMFASNVW